MQTMAEAAAYHPPAQPPQTGQWNPAAYPAYQPPAQPLQMGQWNPAAYPAYQQHLTQTYPGMHPQYKQHLQYTALNQHDPLQAQYAAQQPQQPTTAWQQQIPPSVFAQPATDPWEKKSWIVRNPKKAALLGAGALGLGGAAVYASMYGLGGLTTMLGPTAGGYLTAAAAQTQNAYGVASDTLGRYYTTATDKLDKWNTWLREQFALKQSVAEGISDRMHLPEHMENLGRVAKVVDTADKVVKTSGKFTTHGKKLTAAEEGRPAALRHKYGWEGQRYMKQDMPLPHKGGGVLGTGGGYDKRSLYQWATGRGVAPVVDQRPYAEKVRASRYGHEQTRRGFHGAGLEGVVSNAQSPAPDSYSAGDAGAAYSRRMAETEAARDEAIAAERTGRVINPAAKKVLLDEYSGFGSLHPESFDLGYKPKRLREYVDKRDLPMYDVHDPNSRRFMPEGGRSRMIDYGVYHAPTRTSRALNRRPHKPRAKRST
jgi:hypothetical protein